MKQVKPWWQSTTIWFNVIVAGMMLAEQNVGALQGLVPDVLQKWLVFGLPLVNLILRTVSKHGLSLTSQSVQTGDAQ